MIGVYPGSFDPFTSGHLDILKRAARTFDCVYAAVLENNSKSVFFSVEERKEFIRRATAEAGVKNVVVDSFPGLLVDYARMIGATHIVRGLRAVTDFEYELKMDAMNSRLAPELDTVYYMAEPEHAFLSSSIVREVGAFGGSIEGLVAEANHKTIAERLLKR